MYGWRGRIGLLVPSINTTMETEFWRIAPEGVSVHTARIAGGREGTPEELRNMENASKHAAEEVGMVEPDVRHGSGRWATGCAAGVPCRQDSAETLKCQSSNVHCLDVTLTFSEQVARSRQKGPHGLRLDFGRALC